ncbi:hypothetical protein SB5439_05117 [Klebsiella variicola]|nr:hypothetical protein SB5439_05117 [Klebsiella variicola]
MTFQIPEAESLAKRGFYRRAATIYKIILRDAALNDGERDIAIRRFNTLTYQAEKARLARMGTACIDGVPDYTTFNAVYSGPASVLTLWGCKN